MDSDQVPNLDAAHPVEPQNTTPPAGEEPTDSNQPSEGFFKRCRARFVAWWHHPTRERPKRTDISIMVLTAGIVFFGLMQYLEMRDSGRQTTKIINAANLIEGHQNQMVGDNKQTLSDNRQALADTLKENRNEVASLLQQNRNALDIQTNALNGQLAAIQNQTELSERPWITESAQLGAPVSFDVNGARITFLFTLDNIGHNPAEKVWIEAKLINIISSNMPSTEDHRRICDGPTTKAPQTFTLGDTLFPGKPHSSAWTWTIPWSEIQGERAPNILGPLLYGCIEYSYGLSSKRHSTPFRYAVVQADGRLLVQDGGFSISTREMPQSMVTLRRDGVFGQPSPN